MRGGVPEISLILLDLRMPCREGIETLHEIRQLNKHLPVIMLSCDSSLTTVVEAMEVRRHGFSRQADRQRSTGRRDPTGAGPARRRPRAAEERSSRFPIRIRPKQYMGASTWMDKNATLLRQVGASDVPILLNGETGVGKEVLARTLHAASSRAGRKFLKVNCAALPSELIGERVVRL